MKDVTETGSREKLLSAGIYLILILALLRFLIYPLFNIVEQKKQSFKQQQESYRLKVQLLSQQKQNHLQTSPVVEKAALTPYLYEKAESLLQIQLDVVHRLSTVAKEKGGEMLRFEVLEAIPGKNLSEAPVNLWFRGRPQALMDILGAAETSPKILGIKGMEINKGPKEHVLSLTLSAYRLEK